MVKYFFLLAFVFFTFMLKAQEDTTNTDNDFDFSEFELAAPAAKAYCNNKVLGQSPTSLIGFFYDFQAPHDFTAGNLVNSPGANIADEARVNASHGFTLAGNFPLISRNNILINANVVYQEQRYQISGSDGAHPLTRSLAENGIRRAATLFTVFKPLNESNFILGQVGMELNGDYTFSNFQSLSTLRVPLAVLYGWKPNDRLMYAFGMSRTYLGGALNYVPIVYYYHTFSNQKWGVEALLPARGLIRYRFSSLSLMSLGFNVQGATYRLNNFTQFANEYNGLSQPNTINELRGAREIELRRSEIRLGLNYQRAISGFFWISAEVGYRVNYSFELDQDGDFTRFFGSDEPYFIENQLGNPLYFNVGISYVSP